MRKLLLILSAIIFLVACGEGTTEEQTEESEEVATEEVAENQEEVETSSEETDSESEESTTENDEDVLADLSEEEREELDKKLNVFEGLANLIENNRAFDVGDYIPGDIPEGEYAFIGFDGSGKYFAEKEINGSIIENENFDSFGYVYVHGVGNVETRAVLVSVDDLEEIGVSGAKELYEMLNEFEDYNGSGYYRVGVDIDPGEYVFESIGKGYVAVMSGPVGNSDIVNNENFEGRFAVELQDGQYLKVSRATIIE